MVSTNGTGLAEETVAEKRLRRRREHRIEQIRQRSNHDALINEFQPDAVELERRAVPGGARWTLYTVVGLLIATVTWANWAEVDRIVTADGKLINVDTPIVIDSKLPTPIASINAKFGDRVPAGFVIATLDPTFSDADLKQLEVQAASLKAVIARLTAERDGQEFSLAGHESDRDWTMQYQLYSERQNEYEAEMRKFDTQQETLQVQMENNDAEVEINLKNYELYSDYLFQINKLFSQGSSSKLDVIRWEMQASDARMKVITGNSKKQELLKSMEAVTAEREAYIATSKRQTVTDLVAASDELKGIEQELNKAVRQNQFVELKVPEDLPYDEFVVLEVAEKSVGSVIQPGEALFKLIPVGSPMELEVEVEGKDIARLKPATEEQIASGDLPGGSAVSVKLSSFPYQKHGVIEGAVRTISEGSYEQQLAGGMATGKTMYKVRIRLFQPYGLEEVPEDFRLMPGMNATAEIKVGRRKVIDYFLYPLIRAGEALREP